MNKGILTMHDISVLVAPICRKHGVSALYIFGSYANGTADEKSDVDLLIDTAGSGITSLFALGSLYSELEEALNKPIDLITVNTLSQSSPLPGEDEFRNTVMKERVKIYEPA